jgi:3-phosphoshikimate 1-carboxyvinyltransferase
LICAALAEDDSETFISCSERSEDMEMTVGCLQALGAKIGYENNGFTVKPINRQMMDYQKKYYDLNCGESGSTLRFMLPVCGALGLNVSFQMGGRLPSRPLSGLYEEFAKVN